MADSKNKSKGKFNIIDVFLCVLILLCVAVVVYITVFDGKIGNIILQTEKQDVIFIIEVEEIPDLMRGEVSVGNIMYETESDKKLGEVIDVQYSDSESNNNIDMKITVSTTASVNKKGGYTVGDKFLRIGEKINFNVPFLTSEGVIISVNEVKN